MQINKEAVLDYLARMKMMERMKWRTRAELSSGMTPAELLRQGDSLRRYAYSLHPDWPTEEHNRADLLTHARVAEMLSSVTVKSGR